MELIDYFKLPEQAKLNQRIYVKDIVEALEATGSKRVLFEKSINTIYLVGLLNEQTCGIWKYEDESYLYEEIQIFVINLKDNSKIKPLNEEIQKVFPNPIIVIYKYQDKYLLSTALKRRNKLDSDKSVIDSIQITDWFKFDSLHDELLSKIDYKKRNLKDFYESIDYILSAEYIVLITKKVPEVTDFTIKEKSIMIRELLEKKEYLVRREKEETSMQGKMQCHIEIKSIEDKLKKIK